MHIQKAYVLPLINLLWQQKPKMEQATSRPGPKILLNQMQHVSIITKIGNTKNDTHFLELPESACCWVCLKMAGFWGGVVGRVWGNLENFSTKILNFVSHKCLFFIFGKNCLPLLLLARLLQTNAMCLERN